MFVAHPRVSENHRGMGVRSQRVPNGESQLFTPHFILKGRHAYVRRSSVEGVVRGPGSLDVFGGQPLGVDPIKLLLRKLIGPRSHGARVCVGARSATIEKVP